MPPPSAAHPQQPMQIRSSTTQRTEPPNRAKRLTTKITEFSHLPFMVLSRSCGQIPIRRYLARGALNRMNPSDWAEAKLTESQAFKRISEANSQADWLKAWGAWTATVQRLRQLAKHPEPATEGEAEFELQS
jgi:hypothetical protein